MFLIIWIICIAFATWIGSSKGRPGLGFLLGFLLGIIGVIIIACCPPLKAVVPE